ncbi:MAG TPA: NAD-dependent epimerase/dehydratase family protein [Tepidisphaeraceae bacterium]|jgi:UDP-glucose 4-epimerase|nr:NAD-dependent epimerase/dehydratase family protein [Tepidisphaeraceae bacterium]
MAKRFLVTGGAGFIGSHLAELLVAGGNTVTILDDLSTGNLENLSQIRSHPGVQIVKDSVENERVVNIAMASCDAVFHLAAAVGVQLIVDQPVRTIRSIIHGTEVVLESAQRFGRPVLIASSSEVYGKGARVPFSEDDDVVVGPTRSSRWCYAYSKGIDEFLGLAYHKQDGLPVVIVRLFNTVGPRQIGMYGMVLPRFVAAALKNEPVKVYGDGKQTRCFCHVGDVVDACVRLMDKPEAIGQVFNLGSDEEISISDLARRVIAVCKSSSPIEYISYERAYGQRFDDTQRRVPKLDRIRSMIDFRPRHDLDQMIQSVKDFLGRS